MKTMVKLISCWMLLTIVSFAQQEQSQRLPDIKIKDLQGRWLSARTLQNDGKPFVISFWATWCKPCLVELETLKEVYPDWQEETGVKIIAISIDDVRNSRKVAPFVKSRGWEYEIYLDENSELRRALGVTNIPHTFLLDGNGHIVWQHAAFTPGDEEELYEKIQALVEAEKARGENQPDGSQNESQSMPQSDHLRKGTE